MIGISGKTWIMLLSVTVIISAVTVACGNDKEPTSPPMSQPINEALPDEDVVITIGNLSDLTGVSASAMKYINLALDDVVQYYNDNNLVPGVKLEVITYDGQMDPAKDVPGYQWLMRKGADLILTPIPAVSITLKPRADEDKIVLFAMTSQKEGFLPPGYTFNLGIDPQYDGYTIMKWISENDWDWKTNGPAKVGGAAWTESYSDIFLDGMKEYCLAHPEQFEWEGAYLTDFGFSWESEVDALKDCDYVYPGIVFINFVKQYRNAGHTEATFIATETQAAFFDMVDDSGIWNEIDGMLFLKFSRWWNEEGEIIDLIKKIMYEYHPSEAEQIISAGVGYLSMTQMIPMLNVIADAVDVVGPQSLDSQAIYDAAQSYSLMTDGVVRLSFGEDKRDAVDAYAVYEVRSEGENIFRLHDEWYPTVRTP